MSTDMEPQGHHEQVEYERQDLSSAGIFAFLIGLAVLGILIQFAVMGTLHLFEKYNSRHQPPPNPLVTSSADTRSVKRTDIEKFPQPRLEDNERTELREFREKEVDELNTYGEGANGAAHIPIERAMELIAERGLPTRPQAGTTPPSIVNTANQAAMKSDTSNMTSAKKAAPKKK